jgi:transposase
VKDRETVELVDLPCFGRPTRLQWRKVRFVCRNRGCEILSWTWDDRRIGFPRRALSERAGR